jgi:hypothetical protein
MKTTTDQLIEILEERFPKETFQHSEQFDGSKNGIWCGAEPGPMMSDKRPAFNYYAEDMEEKTYVMGVHKEMIALLDEHDFFAEFYDAGTVMIYPN